MHRMGFCMITVILPQFLRYIHKPNCQVNRMNTRLAREQDGERTTNDYDANNNI